MGFSAVGTLPCRLSLEESSDRGQGTQDSKHMMPPWGVWRLHYFDNLPQLCECENSWGWCWLLPSLWEWGRGVEGEEVGQGFWGDGIVVVVVGGGGV